MKLKIDNKQMQKTVKLCVLSLLLLGLSNSVSAQQVTVSNNLLYDAWLTPNLRLGVRLAPHWSMGDSRLSSLAD